MTTIPPPTAPVESAREALRQALAALDRVLDPMAPPASAEVVRAAEDVAIERAGAMIELLLTAREAK